ncbi:MAG: hypothetical protein ACLPX5_01885 [Dissulfurispiraceae bacterium]
MKRVIFVVMAALFIFLLGCASKDYVKQQNDPLIDRMSKLEANQCSCQAATIDPSYLKRAEDAAKRSEDAERMSEAAAMKCQKAFELMQHK